MKTSSDRRPGVVGVGRPRDPQVDRSILAATREVLVENGYQKTTITAIARRAKVGTSAIYRRWATKESIVEDAVFGGPDASLPAATASLRDDLLAWTRLFLNQIAEPAARAAIPGLLSAYLHDHGAYERLILSAEDPVRVALAERVAAEFPDRSADETTAAADAAFDLLVSATIVRGLTNGLVDADAFCARTADSLVLLVSVDRSEFDSVS
ncbi:TetR/AcrR family transcriptional regulator [Rhodococcus sp. W8901]|uniref:TetR/AcrR family transcriptional regulator n=1 Tax=Rhodococcus sp. W8901 TaxID=2742603 RepID=UPI0034A0B15D